jgi:hypothetical protein
LQIIGTKVYHFRDVRKMVQTQKSPRPLATLGRVGGGKKNTFENLKTK